MVTLGETRSLRTYSASKSGYFWPNDWLSVANSIIPANRNKMKIVSEPHHPYVRNSSGIPTTICPLSRTGRPQTTINIQARYVWIRRFPRSQRQVRWLKIHDCWLLIDRTEVRPWKQSGWDIRMYECTEFYGNLTLGINDWRSCNDPTDAL